MADKKWVFIINPIAGNGFALTYAETVQKMIEKFNVNAEIVFTERKGHATELAAQYADNGFQHIIAVGGDGTINETINGIMTKEVTFGAIPAGTGNDFTPLLGFDGHFTDENWHTFFNDNIIKMDVGECNGHYFVNGMGLGFDAQVAAENYKDGQVKMGGRTKYFWHIIKTLLFFKEHKMTIIKNNKEQEYNCFINTIGNGRRFGGGYYLTCKAIANDGLFDILMVEKLNLLQRFGLFPQVNAQGKHLSNPNIKYYQTNELHIRFQIPVPYHLDGELFFSKDLHVKIYPEKLNVIYNPSGGHYFKLNQ